MAVLFRAASACGRRRAGEGEVSGGIPGGHRVRGHLLGPERDGEVLNGVDQEVAVPPGMVVLGVTTPVAMPTSASTCFSHPRYPNETPIASFCAKFQTLLIPSYGFSLVCNLVGAKIQKT